MRRGAFILGFVGVIGGCGVIGEANMYGSIDFELGIPATNESIKNIVDCAKRAGFSELHTERGPQQAANLIAWMTADLPGHVKLLIGKRDYYETLELVVENSYSSKILSGTERISGRLREEIQKIYPGKVLRERRRE